VRNNDDTILYKRTGEDLKFLANKFLKDRDKARLRYQKYVKRMNRAGFHRISSVWLQMSVRDIRDFAQWLKKQDPKILLWLMKQDLEKLKEKITQF